VNNLFPLCKVPVEKSPESKWIVFACFAINGILILLIIALATLYITKHDIAYVSLEKGCVGNLTTRTPASMLFCKLNFSDVL